MKSSTSFCSLVAVVFGLALAQGSEVPRSEIFSGGLIADYYAAETPKNVVVLLLGGAEGGKPDSHLPAMLAAEGFPVLAPAYFKAKGLLEIGSEKLTTRVVVARSEKGALPPEIPPRGDISQIAYASEFPGQGAGAWFPAGQVDPTARCGYRDRALPFRFIDSRKR